jgi:hypothetical protein
VRRLVKRQHYEYWCDGCRVNLSHPPCKIPSGRITGANDVQEPFVAFGFKFYCFKCTSSMFHRFRGWFRRRRYGLKLLRQKDLEAL